MSTQKLYAEQSISISELKKNPNVVFKDADRGAVAVLSHNKPQGYVLSQKLYVELIETIERLTQEISRQQDGISSQFRPTKSRMDEILNKGYELLAQASDEELGRFTE